MSDVVMSCRVCIPQNASMGGEGGGWRAHLLCRSACFGAIHPFSHSGPRTFLGSRRSLGRGTRRCNADLDELGHHVMMTC